MQEKLNKFSEQMNFKEHESMAVHIEGAAELEVDL